MIRAAVIALAVAGPASATQRGPRAPVVAPLTTAFGEIVVSRGIVADSAGNVLSIMETYVNPVTGTFTVLLTGPDGVACLAASGGSFEAVKVGDPA